MGQEQQAIQQQQARNAELANRQQQNQARRPDAAGPAAPEASRSRATNTDTVRAARTAPDPAGKSDRKDAPKQTSSERPRQATDADTLAKAKGQSQAPQRPADARPPESGDRRKIGENTAQPQSSSESRRDAPTPQSQDSPGRDAPSASTFDVAKAFFVLETGQTPEQFVQGMLEKAKAISVDPLIDVHNSVEILAGKGGMLEKAAQKVADRAQGIVKPDSAYVSEAEHKQYLHAIATLAFVTMPELRGIGKLFPPAGRAVVTSEGVILASKGMADVAAANPAVKAAALEAITHPSDSRALRKDGQGTANADTAPARAGNGREGRTDRTPRSSPAPVDGSAKVRLEHLEAQRAATQAEIEAKAKDLGSKSGKLGQLAGTDAKGEAYKRAAAEKYKAQDELNGLRTRAGELDEQIARLRNPTAESPQQGGRTWESDNNTFTGMGKNKHKFETAFPEPRRSPEGFRIPDNIVRGDGKGNWETVKDPGLADFVADSKLISGPVTLTSQIKGFIEIAKKTDLKVLLLQVDQRTTIHPKVHEWAREHGVSVHLIRRDAPH